MIAGGPGKDVFQRRNTKIGVPGVLGTFRVAQAMIATKYRNLCQTATIVMSAHHARSGRSIVIFLSRQQYCRGCGWRGFGLAAAGKHTDHALDRLTLPRAQLVGVNLMPCCDLPDRLVTAQRPKRNLRLELICKPPAFRHFASLEQARDTPWLAVRFSRTTSPAANE